MDKKLTCIMNSPSNNVISTGITAPKIIMVETSHPGNIGAAARAMKTMCLSRLALVDPKSYPDPVAFARSSGAADILDSAAQFTSLSQAIADCQIVVGITARSRRLAAPVVSPKKLIKQMLSHYPHHQVGWVFGRESHGLSNEEIDLCNLVCTIPSNPEYGSLNIAAAIQVLCYEWYAALNEAEIDDNEVQTGLESLASVEEREGFYQHLWQMLASIDFMDKHNPTPLQRKLRRMFDRTHLSKDEINILRGILKSILKQ